MADRSRIPKGCYKTVAYIIRVDNYQQLAPVAPNPANGERLGLTTMNVSDHHDMRVAIEKHYGFWSDETLKTTPVNKEMMRLIRAYRIFEQPLLDIVASSPNLTTRDETVYGLVGDGKRKKKKRRVGKMKEKCFANMSALGGGEMYDKVRTNGSSKRYHIFEDATGFECAYTLTDKPQMLVDPDNAKSKTFTKSKSILELGAGNGGRYINHCERWVYAPNTKLNGPWSASQSHLIV